MYANAMYTITKKDEQLHYYATQAEGPDYIKVKTVISPVYVWHNDTLVVDQTDALQSIVATIDNEQKRLLEMIIDNNKQNTSTQWTDPISVDETTSCKVLLTEYPCAICDTVIPVNEYMEDPYDTVHARAIRNTKKREKQLNKAYENLAQHDNYILYEAAKVGSVQMIEHALIKGANPNKEVLFFMVDNATPLMVAVLSGCCGCIRMLIEYGGIDYDNRALKLATSIKNPYPKLLRILIDADKNKIEVAKRSVQANVYLSAKQKEELIDTISSI